MLLRFLGIATMSVTFLTIQAMNSTETKSKLASTTIQSSEEKVVLGKIDRRRLDRLKSNSKPRHHASGISITTSFNPRTLKQNKPRLPKIIIASIGEISLILPNVEFRVRPSYLPPIDFINNDNENPDAKIHADSNKNNDNKKVTASLANTDKSNSDLITQRYAPKKAIRLQAKINKYTKTKKYSAKQKAWKKRAKRKYRKSKTYKRKYAALKKSKYKKLKRAKSRKSRANRHYQPANYFRGFN